MFKPHSARRIVLATNVAETSLTVPGIRYVIDTGARARQPLQLRNKVEQLQIETITQASANQRAGRCGRVAAASASASTTRKISPRRPNSPIRRSCARRSRR